MNAVPFTIRYTPHLLGLALSFNAGFLNALSIIEPLHLGVSHVTGSLSHWSTQLFLGGLAAPVISVVFGFLAGAVVSGLVLGGGQFNPAKRYGLALLLESTLIFGAWGLWQPTPSFSLFLLAVGCGLQNGLFTAHSKAVIRTTHLSGVVTDLGLAIGRGLREGRLDRTRLGIYLVVLSGFFGGGVAGAAAWSGLHQGALVLSGSYTAAMGLAYWGFRRKHFT